MTFAYIYSIQTTVLGARGRHSNPTGNDAFCVVGNVGGELKDAATRCVLRPVKMRLRPDSAGGVYIAPPTLLAGFREGEYGRENGRGWGKREGKGEERKGRE